MRENADFFYPHEINRDRIQNSDSLKNMLDSDFLRKKIEDCRNHSDDVEDVEEFASRKNLADQRKSDNLEIREDNVEIGVSLESEENHRIKNGAANVQHCERRQPQKIEKHSIENMHGKAHYQKKQRLFFRKKLEYFFAHKNSFIKLREFYTRSGEFSIMETQALSAIFTSL